MGSFTEDSCNKRNHLLALQVASTQEDKQKLQGSRLTPVRGMHSPLGAGQSFPSCPLHRLWIPSPAGGGHSQRGHS